KPMVGGSNPPGRIPDARVSVLLSTGTGLRRRGEHEAPAATTSNGRDHLMKQLPTRAGVVASVVTLAACIAAAAWAVTAQFNEGDARAFDPAKTFLVASNWIDGIGCPTAAGTSSNGSTKDGTYTDTACPTGDSRDGHNQGLLLAKTGPTANFASGVA